MPDMNKPSMKVELINRFAPLLLDYKKDMGFLLLWGIFMWFMGFITGVLFF